MPLVPNGGTKYGLLFLALCDLMQRLNRRQRGFVMLMCNTVRHTEKESSRLVRLFIVFPKIKVRRTTRRCRRSYVHL